jgi:hypothetical protein
MKERGFATEKERDRLSFKKCLQITVGEGEIPQCLTPGLPEEDFVKGASNGRAGWCLGRGTAKTE